MSKTVDSSVYSKEYYLTSCLGFDEFKNTYGNKVHQRTLDLLSLLKLKRGVKLLDLGCGRGDLVIYCAKKGIISYGVDYSKDGIALANSASRKQTKETQKNIHFLLVNAVKLDFPDDFFDVIISIDLFEHLTKEELEFAMKEISRVLKKEGVLLVHTEPNKIYLNFTHKFYVYPVSSFLLKINNLFFKKQYPGLPADPRNKLHKIQHVNEPTFFYLKNLFSRHKFSGKIDSKISLLKPRMSWKDNFYNFIILFYPLCFLPPFKYFFAYDFVAIMKNEK